MKKRSTQLHKKLKQEVLNDPDSLAEYQAFKLQLELAAQMKRAREHSALTQDHVAEIMHTQKPVVARLEAAGGKGRHSPSIKTLVKYANAIGYKLKIQLVPLK